MPTPEFIFSPTEKVLSAGQTAWRAPSNIALVKYWGKYGEQRPKNPSLSFTLDRCATETELSFSPKEKPSEDVNFEIIFEGKPAPKFQGKINTFFKRIAEYVPFLQHYRFTIDTKNTFPHSSGIASSASGMAALALCIMDMEARLNPAISGDYFYQKASFLARLGSGSAARSIEGPVVIWGNHALVPPSSDDFGLADPVKLHPVFEDYHDSILIVDEGKKQVSSSVGHDLMIDHPFAESRFKQADQHLELLLDILEAGALGRFIELVETEALALHAMMMTSSPYFLLMKPNTLEIIQQIQSFRRETGNHLCFTLDAGANVHLLYPRFEKESTQQFINDRLLQFCEQGKVIHDRIGHGAKRLA